MDTPISLADLCYLHIISHLEHYPLHHLAKLSCPVRRRLLQNLPASDIIELENTCVTDGIGDLENEVWKQSCVCQTVFVDKESGARQSLLSVALNHLFSSVDKYLQEWLFSVPKCLGIADMTSFTSVACDDLDRLVPHRYAALFHHNITSRSEFHAQVITILNKAGFKPAKINTNGGFAIDMNSQYVNDLSVLVSAVDTVKLIAEDNQLLSVIKAICMNERPTLRSLTVRGGDNYFMQMCISLLLEASVIGLESLHCTAPISDGDCTRLVEFLSGQVNMKELELFSSSADYELPDGNTCRRDQRWVSCIGNLMMRPDFELFKVQVNMSSNGIAQCAFTILLNLFLSAPASKQKKIKASTFDFQPCECNAGKAVMPCVVGSNSLEYKEATFIGDDEVSLFDSILKCLSNFEIQLKRLAFENYILEDINLFAVVFSSSTFAVREVHLYYVEFPKFTCESDFHCLDGLLSKPTLKVFELSGIGGDEMEDIENELKMLANALTKQASVGTLESFIYDEFEASLYGIDGVEEFVRALLCLPQFLQLQFSLRYPSELADMANEFWAECAKGCTLKPSPPNCTNSLLEVMLGIRE